MNEHDDYLFDPGARPDPEVQALERALLPLRFRGSPRHAPVPAPADAAHRRRPWWLVAAAAAVVAAALGWLAIRPAAGLTPATPPRRFVASAEPLVVPLGALATITLRPRSELEFVHWRPEQALFALVRGGLEARVQPPPKVAPGFFAVDTPLGRVVDQGCRYTLDLHDDGTVAVAVQEGAVTFARGNTTVFVPAGAGTVVDAAGARTPCFADATAELQKAVREYDLARQDGAPPEQRGLTVKQVLAAARVGRDSLVLWHLLRDPEPEYRRVAEDHLLELVGPPHGGKTGDEPFDPEVWLPFLRLAAWQRG